MFAPDNDMLALLLLVIPALIIVAVTVLGVVGDFSWVTAIIGALVSALVITLLIGLTAEERHIEDDEGIED